MAVWLLIAITAAIFLAMVIIGFFIAKWAFKENEYYDYTLVENYMSEYTGGFSEGELIDIIPSPDRYGYVIKPKDIDFLRRLSKREKLEIPIQIIWAYPYQVENMPKGVLSKERNKIKIFPPSPEDIPDSLKSTQYGQSLMSMVAKKKANKTAVEIIRSERDLEDELLKQTKGRDLFRKYLSDDKSLSRDFMRKHLDSIQKETKPSGGFQSYQGNQQ
jgi:hypothetical protein